MKMAMMVMYTASEISSLERQRYIVVIVFKWRLYCCVFIGRHKFIPLDMEVWHVFSVIYLPFVVFKKKHS